MITKNQWDEFVTYVHAAKMMGINPFMNGRRVIEVDVNKKEIVTIKQGEPNIRYKHPDSIINQQTLIYLHSTITFPNINLKDTLRYYNFLSNKNKI